MPECFGKRRPKIKPYFFDQPLEFLTMDRIAEEFIHPRPEALPPPFTLIASEGSRIRGREKIYTVAIGNYRPPLSAYSRIPCFA